jgi:hypothetical protein
MNQNFTDSPWLGNIYRLHRFRSTASPVKGLTADILVRPPSPSPIFFPSPFVPISPVDELREKLATAGIACAREPVFQRWSPGQWITFAEVQRGLEVDAISRAALPPGYIVPMRTVIE